MTLTAQRPMKQSRACACCHLEPTALTRQRTYTAHCSCSQGLAGPTAKQLRRLGALSAMCPWSPAALRP